MTRWWLPKAVCAPYAVPVTASSSITTMRAAQQVNRALNAVEDFCAIVVTVGWDWLKMTLNGFYKASCT
jgi:hypothetical protein